MELLRLRHEGRTTQEEPLQHIREDTRADPQRHQRAISRLTGEPFRPRVSTALRQTAEDHRRERG